MQWNGVIRFLDSWNSMNAVSLRQFVLSDDQRMTGVSPAAGVRLDLSELVSEETKSIDFKDASSYAS